MLSGTGCLSLQCHSLFHPTIQLLKLLRLQTPPQLPPPNAEFPLFIPEKCLRSLAPAHLLPTQKIAPTSSMASHSSLEPTFCVQDFLTLPPSAVQRAA